MKRHHWLCRSVLASLLLCMPFPANARQTGADLRMLEQLQSHDFFGLLRNYESLRDSLSPAVELLTRAKLETYSNRPTAAFPAASEYLAKHQSALDGGAIVSAAFFMATNLFFVEQFADAEKFWRQLTSQLAPHLSPEDQQWLESIHRSFDGFRNCPQSTLNRPERICEIPCSFRKAGRGELLFVPGEINGKPIDFIFDTGAKFNVVSERLAREIGLDIVADSIPIAGAVARTIGKLGYADSLRIGDLLIRNALFGILPPEAAADSVFRIEAILGFSSLKRNPGLVILPQEGRILFPYPEPETTNSPQNLLIDGVPYVEAASEGDTLCFLLDTGAARSELLPSFYETHRETVESAGTVDTLRSAGIGGVQIAPGYRLPAFPLRIGTAEVTFQQIPVHVSSEFPTQWSAAGFLGADLIRKCKKVSIDFQRMVFAIELNDSPERP